VLPCIAYIIYNHMYRRRNGRLLAMCYMMYMYMYMYIYIYIGICARACRCIDGVISYLSSSKF